MVEVSSPQRTAYQNKHAIIIFDGVCVLCNGFVDFILKNDKKKSFLFLPNQSEKAQKFLSIFNFQNKVNASVYVLQGGKIYKESTAALRVLKIMGFPFNIFYFLIVIPSFLRNIIYRFIAANRYRWFGKRESCRIINQ